MFFQVYLIRDVSVGENTENPYPTQNRPSLVRGWKSRETGMGFTLLDEKYNLVIGISVVCS